MREADNLAPVPAPAAAPPAAQPALTPVDTLLDSYRRLAEVFHDLLSEQTLESVLDRIADTLADLIPFDAFTIYQADESRQLLIPLMSRDAWAEEIMQDQPRFGEGITGAAVVDREPQLVNDAHLDSRVQVVPGTPPDEAEALISIPLVARGAIKGALNVYRLGKGAVFSQDEFELAKRFGDAAALALDNAETRAGLELQAKTDSLTGLYNHRYFHERLRAELNRASRAHDRLAVLMLDIDDFKRVNDVWGHGTGDQVLARLAGVLKDAVRSADVVCRLGGEEFGVIMAGGANDACGLARRLIDEVAREEFEPAGKLTLSIGIAQGPDHAMNPRELVACAEAAMMTAKTHGKNQAVLFDESATERPDVPALRQDVRSIAHLKMLQSLAGKLNRLNDVREIGSVIVEELRMLIDYHNCRVYVAQGEEDLVPIAFKGTLGEYEEESVESLWCKFGEGITGTAAARGEPLLVNDALHCEFAVDIPGTDDIDESMIAVPLCYGSRTIGVVVISKLGIDQFDEDDVRLLEVLAGHASVALENARLYEAQRAEAENAKTSLEIAEALLEFSRQLATAETLDEVLTRLVELSTKTLGAVRSSIWLQEAATGDILPAAVWGYDVPSRERVLSLRFPADAAEGLLAHTEPFVLGPQQIRSIEGAPVPDGLEAAIAPLRFGPAQLGCIAVAAPLGHFGQSDRKMRLLAGIANQAKLAIESVGSFQRLEETFLSTVEALANTLEANDEYTSTHTRWISEKALEIGRALGLDARALKRLQLGALFHDIGKIGIPSSILAKPGPLTEEERAVMQTHPQLGERILAPIARLEDVRPIVRHCHERWDGAGYPDGLSGEDIPVESRIILVCDAFHAMTSDRPYRARLSVEEACRRLREGSGRQFDPAVVDVFLPLVDGQPAPE